MATHIPVLVRAFAKTKGDILEIGTGYFSTALLRWLCEMSGRTLYSYEHSPFWYAKAKATESDFHKVIKVETYDELPVDKQWGLVFIDHAPDYRRQVEIERFANNADMMVVHDTNPEHDKGYHYSNIWHLFKYRYDFKLFNPNTSVVSNFIDLKDFE